MYLWEPIKQIYMLISLYALLVSTNLALYYCLQQLLPCCMYVIEVYSLRFEKINDEALVKN